jgi:Bax protein
MKKSFYFFIWLIVSLGTTSCEDKETHIQKPSKNITVAEKKQRFKTLLLPPINEVYITLMNQYKQTKKWIKNNSHKDDLLNLQQYYKVNNNKDLLKALKPHPKSIALAQSAMESGWATSRFTIEANNLFGIWSFNKNEPRIRSSQKRGNKIIWIKKYPNIKASISDYYYLLATSSAFKSFRRLKMRTNNPFLLVKKLDRYSELGSKYTSEIATMIRYNNFTKYDK